MRLLPHRSPRQSSANTAVGGLEPPPAGRLRGAKPSSLTQHRLKKPCLHPAPLDARDTRGSRLSRGAGLGCAGWAVGRADAPPARVVADADDLAWLGDLVCLPVR